MSTPFQICVDCADPHSLARFWAAAMDYEMEDHAPGSPDWAPVASGRGVRDSTHGW